MLEKFHRHLYARNYELPSRFKSDMRRGLQPAEKYDVTHRCVFNIPQQVLHTHLNWGSLFNINLNQVLVSSMKTLHVPIKSVNLFRFLCSNLGGNMFKGFVSRGPIVVDLLYNLTIGSMTNRNVLFLVELTLYASVGSPILVGLGSMMTRTELGQYFLIRSLIKISFW